jgi:hypothetical protein
MMRTTLYILLLCLVALIDAGPVAAQNIYAGNPADPGQLEATFSNPALNIYIRDRLALAMTSHQTGVAEDFFTIRSGILAYHFPWRFRGFAAGAQYLKMGMYSQTDFRVSYGRAVLRQVAVGANLDVFSRSFDASKFVMFNANDPVFKDGTSTIGVAFGLGAAYEPDPALTIGLSVENLNQPDIAIGSEPFKLPISFSLGLKWHLPTINAVSAIKAVPVETMSSKAVRHAAKEAHEFTQFGAQLPLGRAEIRIAADPSVVQIETEARLYGNVYLNYRYGYPLTDINAASAGTHRFGFLFDFNRMPPLQSMPSMPKTPGLLTGIQPLPVSPHGMYFVYSDADTLTVMDVHSRRNIESNIPSRTLEMLFAQDLNPSNSSRSAAKKSKPEVLPVTDVRSRQHGIYSTGYRSILEGIGQELRSPQTRIRPEVISFPGAERRANALVNMLTGDRLAVPMEIPIFMTEKPLISQDSAAAAAALREETRRVVDPEFTTFHILPLYKSADLAEWRFAIQDMTDAVIVDYSGTGKPPDTLAWNWRNPSGDLVPPGLYFYTLKTSDDKGKVDISARGRFDVFYTRRSVTIDVSRKSRVDNVDADNYIFILGSDRVPFQSQAADTTQKQIH